MTDLASLVARLQADNSQYVKALDQATSKLSKFAKDQDSILNDIFNKFAAAFTVDKILDFSLGAIEAQASLQRFSQEAGVSVEQLSGLSLAAAASGITTEELGVSFKKLNEAISSAAGDGTSKAATAFKILGISVTDANGNLKDAGQVNEEVADAFANSADGANKVALAVELFGKNGIAMIPTLDKGAAGLRALQQEAIDAGSALSGPAAAAAEEFENRLNVLEAETRGGLSNAIAGSLVPALNAAIDAFGTAKDRGDGVRVLGEGIASVLKVAAAVVLEFAGGFVELGNVIGAVGAAAVAAAKGNFSEVASIFRDLDAQNAATIAKYDKAQAALFNDTADAQIAAAKRGSDGAAEAQKPTNQPASLAGAQKGVEGLKELQEFTAGLQKQASSFGLGAVAATQFALAHGKLADALKAAHTGLAQTSADADKAAASAIAAAKAFQFKVDTKTSNDLTKNLQEQVTKLDQSDVAAFKYKITTGELGDAFTRMGAAGAAAQAQLVGLNNQLIDDKDQKAVQALNDKLDQLNGKLVQAAQHAFDLQNKSLSQDLAARGDTGGQAVVQKARDATTAQAAYDEQVKKATDIQQAYAQAVAKVQLLQTQGAITDLQAQGQLNDLQTQEIANLQQVYNAEKAIADGSGIDKLTQQTAQFNTQIVDLQKNTNQLTNQLRGQLESAFADNFSDLITGAKGFKAAFTDMVKSIQKDLANLVSKDLSQAIFGTGGPAGGAAGGLASLFGGGGGGGSGSGAGGGGLLGGLLGSTSGTGSGLLGGLKSLFGGGASSAVTPSGNIFQGVDPIQAGSASDIDFGSLDLFADGGTLGRGNYGIVGENGPELAYSGSKDMHIVPGGSSKGGQSITNNFSVQAPGGTITRQSQTQAAAEMARTASIAARRNG